MMHNDVEVAEVTTHLLNAMLRRHRQLVINVNSSFSSNPLSNENNNSSKNIKLAIKFMMTTATLTTLEIVMVVIPRMLINTTRLAIVDDETSFR